jgi:hypothetical protein
MITYKDIRACLAPHYELTDDAETGLRLLVKFADSGRLQGISVTEVDRNDGTKLLQLSTPVVPLARVDPRQCLEWNVFSTAGGLGTIEIEGEPYIVLVESLFYDGLDLSQLRYVIDSFAEVADQLEERILDGEDLY